MRNDDWRGSVLAHGHSAPSNVTRAESSRPARASARAADYGRSPVGASASPGLIVVPGIEHACEEIVDLIAMAAIESGVRPDPVRGHPRVHAHLREIAGGGQGR